jgi:hypothetical protein
MQRQVVIHPRPLLPCAMCRREPKVLANRGVERYIVDKHGSYCGGLQSRCGDNYLCSVSFKACTVTGHLMNDGDHDQFPWIGTSNPLSGCPGYTER